MVDGDNLASIAKKVYGPDEGNRMVNIERIFQANQGMLQSPDEVQVGQKLIIPPLPALPTTTKAPSRRRSTRTSRRTSCRRSSSRKWRPWADGPRRPTPAPAPEGRWYTVQDGDNLWKIAASQLGSGTRCDEIAKLNAEILNSSETLDVGMKLRLPPK